MTDNQNILIDIKEKITKRIINTESKYNSEKPLKTSLKFVEGEDYSISKTKEKDFDKFAIAKTIKAEVKKLDIKSREGYLTAEFGLREAQKELREELKAEKEAKAEVLAQL